MRCDLVIVLGKCSYLTEESLKYPTGIVASTISGQVYINVLSISFTI